MYLNEILPLLKTSQPRLTVCSAGLAVPMPEERSEFGGAKRGIKILRAIDHGIGSMVVVEPFWPFCCCKKWMEEKDLAPIWNAKS